MSTESHNHHSSEHGTAKSYVIGFILSLIYTFLPYQLVVNKILTGNALLAAILGIAVLQMAIQLLFFLHLGRGPKPLYNVVFFFATAGVIVVTIGASIFIMNNLYHNMTPDEVTIRIAQEENIAQIGGETTGACNEVRSNHTITISDGILNPATTEADLCDTLTFINETESDAEIVFGAEGETTSYGGIYEVEIRKGRPETITLNQAGSFIFRNSLSSQATGNLTVKP